jgi:hypothetical protein
VAEHLALDHRSGRQPDLLEKPPSASRTAPLPPFDLLQVLTATTTPPGLIYPKACSYPDACAAVTMLACGPSPSGVADLIALTISSCSLKSIQTSAPSFSQSFFFSSPVYGGREQDEDKSGSSAPILLCGCDRGTTHVDSDHTKTLSLSVLNGEMTESASRTGYRRNNKVKAPTSSALIQQTYRTIPDPQLHDTHAKRSIARPSPQTA